MKEFDEDEAVAMMRDAIPQIYKAEVDDDTLFEILDLIFDGYDELGLLDVDYPDGEDENKETEQIVSYVSKYLGKSGRHLPHELINALVNAENAYEQTLL